MEGFIYERRSFLSGASWEEIEREDMVTLLGYAYHSPEFMVGQMQKTGVEIDAIGAVYRVKKD